MRAGHYMPERDFAAPELGPEVVGAEDKDEFVRLLEALPWRCGRE
jgi:hypothetical protein